MLLALAFATSIEPGQPAHAFSLTMLYTSDWPTSSFHLDIPENDNGQEMLLFNYPEL